MCSVDDPADPGGGGGPVVRPTAEELLRPPRRDLLCPEPGCGRRLPQPSALRFHLLKRHGRKPVRGSAAQPASAVFACPQADCATSGAAKKTQFGSLKALKQHYMKVHAPRTFVCPECRTAAFATEPLLRAHWRLCGANYQCSCGAQYAYVSTLRSHATKHGHTTLLAVRPPANPSDGLRRLAPKPSPDALHLLASIALAGVPSGRARPVTTCDAGTQTAARRAARGGRSSGTQTRLTSGPATSTRTAPDRAATDPPPLLRASRTAGSQCVSTSTGTAPDRAATNPPPPPLLRASRTAGSQCVATSTGTAPDRAATNPPPPPLPASRTAGSQCGTVAAASAASQAGPPLVWGLLWPAPAAEGLISCQTQTEERQQAQPTQPQSRLLEELLWEAQEESQQPAAPPALATQQSQTPQQRLVPPAAGSQTETDMLSAETQTQDPFDVIKHMLRSEDERLLFPELSELSGTDIQTQTTQPWLTDDSQTQTPWLTGDSQTQTPWWTDDPARMMTSQTRTAPVTHMETQTCLLCLGPCDCWGD